MSKGKIMGMINAIDRNHLMLSRLKNPRILKSQNPGIEHLIPGLDFFLRLQGKKVYLIILFGRTF